VLQDRFFKLGRNLNAGLNATLCLVLQIAFSQQQRVNIDFRALLLAFI
jgi:hypothetical protein